MSPALPVSGAPLHAAARIGQSLCRQAFWDRGGLLCNWMGRVVVEVDRVGGPITPTSAALGPDLYGGSAGIALFLAELFAATDDPECRRTALGAIARSIRQLDRLPEGSPSPLSFFVGHLGVAFAADRVGRLTGDLGVRTRAEALLDRVAEAATAPHLLDVISGNAGAIPALLALGRDPARRRCVALATTLGEELCRAAVRRGAVWTWDVEAASGPGGGSTPLTGLAHGAAGIGLALLELHAATGRPDFLEAARGAFAYEDSVFDPVRGNWPDFRPVESSDASTRPPHFPRAWCHGAPGIALSRLRAVALDPGRAEAHRATARVAIATTLEAIEEHLAATRPDFSLCHGLTGLAEIVLIAGQRLDDVGDRDRVVAVGRSLIDRHAVGDWRSGASSGGPNPSLMLGTAGIGHAFLRLHDPEGVPPLLILTP